MMDKMLVILVVVSLLGFGYVGSANGTSFMAQAEFTCDTTDLIGAQVKNPAGETLGSISDVVFDPKGQPAVVILYQGDLQDLDFTRHVAVPFTALGIIGTEPSQMKVVLNLQKEELLSAPRFDRNKDLKNLSDMNWIAGIYRFYGQQPYWNEEESGEAAPAESSPEG